MPMLDHNHRIMLIRAELVKHEQFTRVALHVTQGRGLVCSSNQPFLLSPYFLDFTCGSQWPPVEENRIEIGHVSTSEVRPPIRVSTNP